MLVARKGKSHQVPEKSNEDLLSPLSPCMKALLKKPEHSSLTPINDCEFYESVDAPTEFNYLEHKVEVCAFTADGAGFRPSWWAGMLVTKAGWLGMQLLALRSLREA